MIGHNMFIRLWPQKIAKLFFGIYFLALISASPVLAEAPNTPSGNETQIEQDSNNTQSTNLALRIEHLIEQLGADRFAERTKAEQELQKIGQDAFDQLKAAEHDEDPEIAHRAKRLSELLTVQWVLPSDSEAVQKIMALYDTKDEQERIYVSYELRDAGDDGLSAMCRIVRFDRSRRVSCQVALNIAEKDPEKKLVAKRKEFITKQLGRSKREGANWLRTYLLELDKPEAAVAKWKAHTDAMRKELEPESANPEDQQLFINLLRRQVRLFDKLKQKQKAMDIWHEIVEIDAEDMHGTMHDFFDWLVQNNDWKNIDIALKRYENRLANDPMILYIVAEAQLERDNKMAQSLAYKAFKLTDNPELRFSNAQGLYQRGLRAWAEREFRKIVKTVALEDPNGLIARQILVSIFHDEERFEEAADMLDKTIADIEVAAKKNRQLKRTLIDWDMNLKKMAAQAAYNRACQYKQENNIEKQKEFIDKALKKDPTDIDAVIARYQLKGVDKAYRTETLILLNRASNALEKRIRDNPGSAVSYNNWAWLISNTEGDFDLAIKRSKKSLQLSGEAAGYLDTLGRCYYAKGDYKNAVKTQKRAVELDPHSLQLKRQLKEFEAALAKKGTEEGKQKDKAK